MLGVVNTFANNGEGGLFFQRDKIRQGEDIFYIFSHKTEIINVYAILNHEIIYGGID